MATTTPDQTVDDYQVKGSSIRSKVEYVQEQFGTEAANRLTEWLDERDLHQVLDANWYSYRLYCDLLERIAEKHFSGDIARLHEIGKYSARAARSGPYDLYFRGDFLSCLPRLTALHGRYYSVGKLTVAECSAGSCRLLLEGAPVYLESDIEVAVGFYTGAAEITGCTGVTNRWHRADDRVAIVLSWST